MSGINRNVTEDEMAAGKARAKLHSLIQELADLRGIPFFQAYNKIMLTEAWRRAGSPDPKHITQAQAEELSRAVEGWIAKARTRSPKVRHIVSKAPPAPWQSNRRTKDEQDQ